MNKIKGFDMPVILWFLLIIVGIGLLPAIVYILLQLIGAVVAVACVVAIVVWLLE